MRKRFIPVPFRARVGCVEECQWHSEGTGLSTRAIGHPLPVTGYARAGLRGGVTDCRRESGQGAVARRDMT